MPRKPQITERGREVLHHILTFEFCHGRLPTNKELCFYTKMTHSQMTRHLARLTECGLLKQNPRGTLPYVVLESYKGIQL